MAEGAPLLREYRVNPLSRVRIPPSPPHFKILVRKFNSSNSLYGLINHNAPVAQLDRVPGYELGGREFESLRNPI